MVIIYCNKNTIKFRKKKYISTSDWKKGLQTSEANEDLINKQTFDNNHRILQKTRLDVENGCFKSEYNNNRVY